MALKFHPQTSNSFTWPHLEGIVMNLWTILRKRSQNPFYRLSGMETIRSPV